MEKMNRDIIKWKAQVPIFKNTVILKDLGIALGIPFGILILILFIISGGDLSTDGIAYPMLMIAMLLASGFLFIMLVYGGKYDAGYVIDSRGILNYTLESQSKKNKVINTLVIVIGILTGKPYAAGAGILAQSRQSVFVKWKNIRKVRVYPKSKSIVIKGGFTEKIALFCNDDNFEQIRDMVLDRVKRNGD